SSSAATVGPVFSGSSLPSTAPTAVIPQHRATRTAPTTSITTAQVGLPDFAPGGGPASCQVQPVPGGGGGGESAPSAFSAASRNEWPGGLTGARPVSYLMFPFISNFPPVDS